MKTINDARAAAADLLNLDLAGGRGASLSQADFFRLESAMADLIVAVPGDYLPAVVTWAREHIVGPNYRRGPETLGLREAAGIFAGEFVAQGQAINPFSEQNRSQTNKLLIGAVLIFLALFFTFSAAKAKAVLDSVK